MSGVTMVMKAPHHIPTGLQGSQALKTEMKIVSLWFQEMEFIRVNGTSNDAMNKMSLYVGKQFETIQHPECSCIVRCNHNYGIIARGNGGSWHFRKELYCQ